MYRAFSAALRRSFCSAQHCRSSLLIPHTRFTTDRFDDIPCHLPADQQTVRDTLRVLRPSKPSRTPSTATTTEVWPMREGIFAEWVPDALGYHLPLGQRESKPREQRSPAAAAPLSEVRRCAATGGSGSSSSSSSFFYGPLSALAVSPVLEWRGCLWQWRPLQVRAAFTRRATPSLKTNSSDDAGTETGSALRDQYLVPFLLLPTAEVASRRPRLSRALRDAVLRRHVGLQREGALPNAPGRATSIKERQAKLLTSASSLWTLTLPTPVGSLAVEVMEGGGESDEEVLSVFHAMEGYRGGGSGAGAAAAAAAAALTAIPPAAETWASVSEAARHRRQSPDDLGDRDENTAPPVGASDDLTAQATPTEASQKSGKAEPYVHVFHTDNTEPEEEREGQEDEARSFASLSPFAVSPMRRNVLGGGLAELLLAMDAYAALIARDELTLSAACWATLCDTKSAWVVQRLRMTPLAVEAELVAAAAAHRRWQRRALSRHHTMVGKSSSGVCFDDYPVLASW